jgi:hypothetical protein
VGERGAGITPGRLIHPPLDRGDQPRVRLGHRASISGQDEHHDKLPSTHARIDAALWIGQAGYLPHRSVPQQTGRKCARGTVMMALDVRRR